MNTFITETSQEKVQYVYFQLIHTFLAVYFIFFWYYKL